MGVSTCGVRRKYYTYFVTNSRGLPSGLQSRPHSGVSRCSALRTSKQKLGAAATLAWDRSGGSIKIFLDARGDSSTSLSPWASTRSAAYKKKQEKKKKGKSRSSRWGGRRGNGFRRWSDSRETRAVDTSQLQLARLSRRCNPKNTRIQFSEMSVTPPLIFLVGIFVKIETMCESLSVLVLLSLSISKYSSRRDRCLLDYLCSRSRKL